MTVRKWSLDSKISRHFFARDSSRSIFLLTVSEILQTTYTQNFFEISHFNLHDAPITARWNNIFLPDLIYDLQKNSPVHYPNYGHRGTAEDGRVWYVVIIWAAPITKWHPTPTEAVEWRTKKRSSGHDWVWDGSTTKSSKRTFHVSILLHPSSSRIIFSYCCPRLRRQSLSLL